VCISYHGDGDPLHGGQGLPPTPHPDSVPPVPRLLALLARHPAPILAGIACLLVVDMVQVWTPWLAKQAVDDLSAARGDRLAMWAGAILAVAALMVGLRYLWRIWLIGTARRIRHDLRRDLLRAAIRQDAAFHARTGVGDLMSRATSDLDAVSMACSFGVMALVDAAFLVVMAAGAMILHQGTLALWVLSPLPVVALIVLVGGRLVHHRQTAVQEAISAFSERLRELLGAARLVKAFAREDAMAADLDARSQTHRAAGVRLAAVQALMDPAIALASGAAGLVLLIVGGQAVAAGTLSAGSFTALAAWLGLLTWPMMAVGWSVNLMARGGASLDRVRAVIEAPPPPAPVDACPVPDGPPAIAVVGLDFAYPSTPDRPVLAGVTCHLPAGGVLGVVGPTGSGKSTLAQLLVRLEEPPPGAIVLWGRDLRAYDPRALRRRAALVPQDPVAFAMSLGDNIAFARPDADPAMIARAAEVAGLGPDLRRWPEGLGTMVGERGVTLSGGQRQRLAIARALISDPSLLILDDCLSALDATTEAAVLAHLRAARSGRTTVIVAHRISAIRDADHIIVLDEGRIIEQGTHASLAVAGGWYAGLNALQEHRR
jgi:ATP-binding cassette subfamily B multidrug efflux pump